MKEVPSWLLNLVQESTHQGPLLP